MPISVSSLTLYPVKSCAGVLVPRLRCGTAGAEWDREWMIVGGDGRFVTQREVPRLALVKPHLDFAGGALHLAMSGHRGGLEIPLRTQGNTIEAEIWGQTVPAIDEGKAAADWLSGALGIPLRLVRVAPELRHVDGEHARTLRFTDDYPLHLVSLSSLEDLNRRLPSPITYERFRPNIVIEGSAPWAEDHWRQIRLGGANFRVGGRRTERCTITTVDQHTAVRGPEPLKTLAGFRRNARNKIEFGQYLHSATGAEIHVGMELVPDSGLKDSGL